MRSSALFMSMYVLLSLSFSIAAQNALILVPDAGPARYEMPVSCEVDNTCIVFADEQQLICLKTRQKPYTMLDMDTRRKEYFLVYPLNGDPVIPVKYNQQLFEKYGTVLACFTSCVLMESDQSKLNAITEYHTRFIALGREPIDYTCRTFVDNRSRPAPYNPLLQEILDRVSKDSCAKFLRDLCAIRNRDIKGTYNKAEVIPYFKKKFREYGCDSIIELPIDGSSGNTMVAGVRFGKKDPTIKRFTLVGGHSDTKCDGGPTARHQGANDNGSGSVGALEACRVHQYYKFDYTILYCALNGEEVGLLGGKAMAKELKRVGAMAEGGVFCYDMLGTKGTSIRYEAYDGNTGAAEFVSRVNELVTTYKPYNVTSVKATSTSSQPTDVTPFWENGYVCAWHNWGSGYGSIHTANSDTIPGSFDATHLTGATKTGLLVTAFYANPISAVPITTLPARNNSPAITWKQTGAGALVISIGNKNRGSGAVLDIFDLHGRVLQCFNLGEASSEIATITWNGKDNVLAAHSVAVIRYKDSASSFAAKILIR